MTLLTFGDVKAQLATVTDNGIGATDARVITRANEATQMLLAQGIWVGTVMTVTMTVTSNLFALPSTMENVMEAKQLTGSPLLGQMFYSIGSGTTYLDPTLIQDNPLVDMGETIVSGQRVRSYLWPALTMTAGSATIRLTGLIRYQPIVDDTSVLLIQNVRALKLGILAIEKGENREGDDGDKYQTRALALLTAEVSRYMLDPARSLERKSDYQTDLDTYDEGTLGRTRAKLALEFPAFITKGKSDIDYLINKAVRMLVDNRNQIYLTGRIGVYGTISELTYNPPVNNSDILSWTDYNQIRLIFQASTLDTTFLGVAQDALYRLNTSATVAQSLIKQAFDLQEAQLTEQTEFLRHTDYEKVLTNANPRSAGFAVARLALDMQDGLKLSPKELLRLVNSAESRLMEQGKFRGTLDQFSAEVVTGYVLFPMEVGSILAASLHGVPIKIRGQVYEYHENTWGFLDPAQQRNARIMVDAGEVLDSDGNLRRRYKIFTPCDDGSHLRVLAKLRWLEKADTDILTVKNYEAIRLMVSAILAERAGQIDVATAMEQKAIDSMDKELEEFLGGIEGHVQISMGGGGLHRFRRIR
jgi:hypothetical protein